MDKDVFSRNILLIDSIIEISKSCRLHNIEILLLKGAALLELGIYEFSEREMTDVDVLIKPEKLTEFENILLCMGFELMKNSSQAFIKIHSKNIPVVGIASDDAVGSTAVPAIRMAHSTWAGKHSSRHLMSQRLIVPDAGGAVPPIIIDVHTNLWHVKNHNDLWENAYVLNKNFPNLFLPCAQDLLLHLLAHPILHHGFLTDKAKSDVRKFMVWINKTSDIDNFWNNLAKKSRDYGLNPVIYHILESLGKSNPDLMSLDKINLFYPENLEKIKAYFFKKNLNKHSNFFEYFLPVLYKPSLMFKYMFPEREFLRRRYGRNGLLVYLTRPFRLLINVLISGHS
jgi:hypothetical protein